MCNLKSPFLELKLAMGDKSSDSTWYANPGGSWGSEESWNEVPLDCQIDHAIESSQSAYERQDEDDDPPSSDSGSVGGSEAVQGRDINVSVSSSSSAKVIARTGTVS